MRASRMAALSVLAALVGAVAVAATSSSPPPSSFGEATPPPSPTTGRPVSSTDAVTVAEPVPVIGTEVRSAGGSVEEAVNAAMEAWGRFAVSGDLDEVSGWFAGDGPQYRQFEEEAEELASDQIGPPPYSVVVENLRVESSESEARAGGRFVFVRTGEASRSYTWVVVLTRRDGRWLVWTVVDDPG